MKSTRRAFTLIELIVVLAILAVILIVVTPKITGYVSEAKETSIKHNAMAAMHAAELYVVDLDRQGKPIPTQVTEKELASYLNNPSKDTFIININKKGEKYEYQGTYYSGNLSYDYATEKTSKIKSP